MAKNIPLVEARGTHREVGQQIGEACQLGIQQTLAELRDALARFLVQRHQLVLGGDDLLDVAAQAVQAAR